MANFSVDLADEILTAEFGGSVYVQLHVGDPGPNGTADVANDASAVDADRKVTSFGAIGNHPSLTARRLVNDAVATWDDTELDEGQVITHVSLWSAVTSGDVLAIGSVDDPPVVGANGAELAVGSISVGIEVWAL